MTTADILRTAKQIIVDRGWTRGMLETKQGCLCPLGAINVAATGRPTRFPEFTHSTHGRAILAFNRAIDANGMAITLWNDQSGRTVEDVYAAFDRAIAFAEPKRRAA